MAHQYKSGFKVRRRLLAAASATALTCGVAAAQQPAEAEPLAFSIESQPLAGALVRFSEQSRIAVVASAEITDGLLGQPVHGEMSAAEALERLLEGTGYEPRIDSEGFVSIQAARAALVPASYSGPAVTPIASSAAAAQAQAQPEPQPQARSEPIERLIVTGVRGRPRSVTDSPTPIDVFTAEDLDVASRTSLFEAVRFLVPSYNVPTRAGGGTSTVIATGGLRGLNPDQVLVLVNGQRRHKTSLINSVSALYNGSAGVDLNMIPAAAIERIEILRDGAAAQYGSDAIAGVINVILNDSAEGGSANATGGANFDRGDGEFFNLALNQGFSLGGSGHANLSYDYRVREASNRAVPIPDTVQLYPALPDGSPDPREQTIDRLITRNFGGFPQITHTFGVNLGYTLENDMELFSFITYGNRVSHLDWTFRRPFDVNVIPEIYPDGFRPRTSLYEDDFEIAAGVRGSTAGWDWVAAANYGFNDSDWESTRGLNSSLGPASPTEFQLGGLRSSEAIGQLDVTRPFDLQGGGELQVSFGAQVRRERYEVKEGEEASWIAGDYRKPAGQPGAGQLLTPGAQASPGFQPDDANVGERTNWNVYGELGWTPNDRLFLGGALRYESFDDSAGDTLIYKVSGRYELLDGFALRASYNTGFRAPGLAQQTYASTTSQFRDVTGDGETELLLLKTLPVNSPAAIALGARPLVPEESRNFSVGFTATPLRNLTLTVDGYQIEIDRRIVISSEFSPLATQESAIPGVSRGQAIQAILVSAGLSPELSGQYYTNAIDTRTQGIDVVAAYSLNTDLGDFRATLGYNWNDTEITRIADNPPELAPLGEFEQFNRNRQSSLTSSIPDSKLALGLNWGLSRYSANLRVTRFGEFTVLNANNPAVDQFQPSKWITDFEVGVDITDRLTLVGGANNVFNVYPELTGPPNAFGAGFYNGLAPFGFTGGSWYLRAGYTW
jgi:iron complex outermembrane receptor protein